MYLLLVFIQVVVLNHISFLTYAIPFVYVYFILKLPISINRNLLLLLGFILGLSIDVFTKTPGINAAATTFIAFIREPVIKLFYMSDESESEIPGIARMGWGGFLKYAILLVFMHTTLLIILESFSFLNIELMIYRILGSTILSTLIIIGLEGISGFNKR